MRRLTLILSDLYLSSEIAPAQMRGNLPVTHELPAFEWLLRFADSPQLVGDWRAWLLAQACPELKDLPVAMISASGRIDSRELESTWLATPVALEARLDHVRLVDRGLLRLGATDRASCGEEFARMFGPQYLLHDGGERGFFLSGLPSAGVPVADPARLLGSEIGPALPPREAGELRRLWTEIEMWLHGAAFNAVRERAGKRRVSALWLWGAGPRRPRGSGEPTRVKAALYGGDPVIDGINREFGMTARGVPAAWSQIDAAAPQVVLEFSPLTGGSHESLSALESHWFAPARSALMTGELQRLEILSNDLCFRVGARPHWRFWRRRKSWLSRLGSAANTAKA